MNDDELPVPRRVVREFSRPKRKNSNRYNSAPEQGNSLEIQPVIKAVQEYARRTHSIGALQGAHAIETLISNIRALGPQNEEMQKLLEQGDVMATELKSYLHKVYK